MNNLGNTDLVKDRTCSSRENIFGVTLVMFLLLIGVVAGCSQAGNGTVNLNPETKEVTATGVSRQNNALFTATPGKPAAQIPTQRASFPDSIDQSVLTEVQRERLYRASLEYVANTESEAVRVARGMRFVENEGHPANFCGPLSIAILRDAGLIDRYTDLHNYWLLNPRDDYTVDYILEKTFPHEDYLWYKTTTPVNNFDFNNFPLYTGDFLYLYAGGRGTFEHIITVSRVDEKGRTYAISAETNDGSYLISELMLYDPGQPGTGYFYDINNPDYSQTLGTTGFGGFRLWRPTSLIPDPSPREAAFRNRMDKNFEVHGGDWHVLIKEVDGKVLYALNANDSIHPASVVKVPLAMLFFDALHEREIDDLRLFLVERGIDGRTYQQLLTGMLVDSEEEAAESILEYAEEFFITATRLHEWGYQYTTINPRRTTATEITRVFEDLWLGTHLSGEENKIILEQLAVYTSGDDSRVGVIRGELPMGAHYFSKRGSLMKGRTIVGEVAILQIGDSAYVVSIFGFPGSGEDAPNYEQLETAIEDASWVIWGYIENLE